MADEDEQPMFSIHPCTVCKGTKVVEHKEDRLFRTVSIQEPCTTCEGRGEMEYVRRPSSDILVPAENWHNSPEGLFASRYRMQTGEYPTWHTIYEKTFGSLFKNQNSSGPPVAFLEHALVHPADATNH